MPSYSFDTSTILSTNSRKSSTTLNTDDVQSGDSTTRTSVGLQVGAPTALIIGTVCTLCCILAFKRIILRGCPSAPCSTTANNDQQFDSRFESVSVTHTDINISNASCGQYQSRQSQTFQTTTNEDISSLNPSLSSATHHFAENYELPPSYEAATKTEPDLGFPNEGYNTSQPSLVQPPPYSHVIATMNCTVPSALCESLAKPSTDSESSDN